MTDERCTVVWTATAAIELGEITDRRVRQLIFDTTKRLELEPAKQGAPLTRDLAGFRDLRAAGQRYRVLYRVDERQRVVHVVAVGLRREGSRDDIYELAKRLLRIGLIEPARPAPRPIRKKKARQKSEERLREDLASEAAGLLALTSAADPVLARLWDNPKDSEYDRL